MFDRDDRDVKTENAALSESEEQLAPSLLAEVIAVPEVIVDEGGRAEVADFQREPQSKSEPAGPEAADQNDPKARNDELSAVDLDERQRKDAEVQTANAPSDAGSDAAILNAPIVCNLPRGCRGYAGCKQQGRCVADPDNTLEAFTKIEKGVV